MKEPTRFEKLALLIDGIHKSIHKMKVEAAPTLGVKAVHVFWVYELMIHPEGLTATELAAKSMIDRSLVSREIEILKGGGYISQDKPEEGAKRNYNTKFALTEKGKEAAKSIFERHTVLTAFLTKVGVDAETAAIDACRIEHVISAETLDAIKKFTEKN